MGLDIFLTIRQSETKEKLERIGYHVYNDLIFKEGCFQGQIHPSGIIDMYVSKKRNDEDSATREALDKAKVEYRVQEI